MPKVRLQDGSAALVENGGFGNCHIPVQNEYQEERVIIDPDIFTMHTNKL